MYMEPSAGLDFGVLCMQFTLGSSSGFIALFTCTLRVAFVIKN